MLTAIAGYYDHGQIILKEDPLVKNKTEVIVTFLNGMPEISHLLLIDDASYEIPEKLTPLTNAIEESKHIFSLPEGWDEGNAKQIPESFWISAARFTIEYALYLYHHFELILEIPEINPVSNGTIDISWRTKNGRMLINIRQENNEMLAYYYGDLYHDRFPVKGCVPANNIAPHLVQWMKDYLAA